MAWGSDTNKQRFSLMRLCYLQHGCIMILIYQHFGKRSDELLMKMDRLLKTWSLYWIHQDEAYRHRTASHRFCSLNFLNRVQSAKIKYSLPLWNSHPRQWQCNIWIRDTSNLTDLKQQIHFRWHVSLIFQDVFYLRRDFHRVHQLRVTPCSLDSTDAVLP